MLNVVILAHNEFGLAVRENTSDNEFYVFLFVKQGETDAIRFQDKINSRNGGAPSKQTYFKETKVLIPEIVSI